MPSPAATVEPVSMSSPPLVLVAEAAMMLCLARMIVLMVPFRVIARRLGSFHPPEESLTGPCSSESMAAVVASGLRRSAGLLPFRANCLTRSLAGWAMLDRRNVRSRFHFGVLSGVPEATPGTRPGTHVWVDCGTVKVAGYPEALLCTELGYYRRD